MSGPRRSFEDHVLEWLRTKGGKPKAASIESIDGHGSDWAGDTEGGFTSVFDVAIMWIDADGVKHYDEITGDDMGSLWSWVVSAW